MVISIAPPGVEKYAEYSVPVDPSAYECDEWFCRFLPRTHRDAHLADAGSWQCQVDFLEASESARDSAEENKDHKGYAIGCINPRVGNFTALCGCESKPERLALITYIIEYAFVHDDVIEYMERKGAANIDEATNELVEGLNPDNLQKGTKEHAKRRLLQAKMAVELLEIDKELGGDCLRLWKEMSDTFADIRNVDFKDLDEYFIPRARDAGCPWTLSLLLFSEGWTITKAEKEQTLAVTNAAYHACILVNDYFSWEKELLHWNAGGCKGDITSSVFLFMKWYSLDPVEAKKMLREEIIAREALYWEMKNEYLKNNKCSENVKRWFHLLETVIAGNFAWSMTTARYIIGAEDAYPGLRDAYQKEKPSEFLPDYNHSVSNMLNVSESSVDSASNSDSQDEGVVTDSPATSVRSSSSDEQKDIDMSETTSYPQLSSFEEIGLEPSSYIESLPSKGVRNSAIDGLEAWFHVPEASLAVIRKIVNTLHNASLMVDDIEDESPLRRGFPATHCVFGTAQTINSSNMLMMKAIAWAQSLSPAAGKIVVDRLIDCHIGQAMDLNWTYHTKVPSEEEYFTMVDGKTGGLFSLLAELMRSEATENRDLDLSEFIKVLGRFFQARDDYQNLCAQKYVEQKGYAEDISEGKISLPLIHALQSKTHRAKLLSIFEHRKRCETLPLEVKQLAVAEIQKSGGLEYTKKIVLDLQYNLEKALTNLERKTGSKNWILRLAKVRLEI